MAEPGRPDDAALERQATSNIAAFIHWLEAVHGVRLQPEPEPRQAVRRWSEADPAAAAALIIRFAGPDFGSARLAAGLLFAADLRPDDRLFVRGPSPDWLPQALAATAGQAETQDVATVLVAPDLPDTLPPTVRRVILTSIRRRTAPPGITLSHSANWTYPSESSAD